MILVILDRDGTVNHSNRTRLGGPYYVLRPEQFELLDNVKEGVQELISNEQVKLHMLTAQNGLLNGTLTVEALYNIHERMFEMLDITENMYFPITVVFGDGGHVELKKAAILNIVKTYQSQGINFTEIYVIGDTEEDVAAGNEAGAKTIHIMLEHTYEKDKYVAKAGYHVKDVNEAVRIILGG